MARRRRELVSGQEVWLAPAEYVVVRKLEYYRSSGSERHLRDVRAILEQGQHFLDAAALEGLVADRGLERELDAARRVVT